MKTKLLIIALSLSISSLVLACPGGGKHRGGGDAKGRMMTELNLTDEQRQGFDAIMKTKGESMKAAMEVIHNDTQTQLAKILSDEQMQILDEKKQHREKRRSQRKERM